MKLILYIGVFLLLRTHYCNGDGEEVNLLTSFTGKATVSVGDDSFPVLDYTEKTILDIFPWNDISSLKFPFALTTKYIIDYKNFENRNTHCLFSINSDTFTAKNHGEILSLCLRKASSTNILIMLTINDVVMEYGFDPILVTDKWVSLLFHVLNDNVVLKIDGTDNPYGKIKITIPENVNATYYRGCMKSEVACFTGKIQELKIYPNVTEDTVKSLGGTANLFDEIEDDLEVDDIYPDPSSEPPVPGPKGDKGDKGEPGESIKGDKGDTGKDGPIGPPGVNGTCPCSASEISALLEHMPEMRGPRGPPGQSGQDGTPGLPGKQGENGPEGKKGEQGIPGLNGIPGRNGTDGINGSKGEIGNRGPEGPKGSPGTLTSLIDGSMSDSEVQVIVEKLKGDKGDKGNEGLKGEMGDQGKRGHRGERGETGQPGSPGDRGPMGERGLPGEDGKQGLKGDPGEPCNVTSLIGIRDTLKGEKGDQGKRGHRGERGETGQPGSQGDLGLKGETGFPGEDGKQGLKGEPGQPFNVSSLIGTLDNLKGEKGDQGKRGHRGERGETGQPGSPGDKGPMGEMGFPGADGKQGPKGDPGEPCNVTNLIGIRDTLKGEKGDQGKRGHRGETGQPGSQGDRGPKGETGLPGEDGKQGLKGEPGQPFNVTSLNGTLDNLKGEKGDQGPRGHRGEWGETGEPGIPGVRGPIGERGLPGADGKQGLKGEPGQPCNMTSLNGTRDNQKIKGEKGDRGDNGLPGPSGPSIKGEIGSPGTPGPRGLIGPRGPPGPSCISLVGPKGEPGTVIYTKGSEQKPINYLDDVSNDIIDDDVGYAARTVIFKTKKGLLRKTSDLHQGTLAYVIQENILMIRVDHGFEKGWRHVQMGHFVNTDDKAFQSPIFEPVVSLTTKQSPLSTEFNGVSMSHFETSSSIPAISTIPSEIPELPVSNPVSSSPIPTRSKTVSETIKSISFQSTPRPVRSMLISHPKEVYETSTFHTTNITRSDLHASANKGKTKYVLRIAALNRPYSGNMTYTYVQNECYWESKHYSRHFRPFLGTSFLSLKNIVPRYHDIPVLNLKNEKLFDSTSRLFDGTGASLPRGKYIYSFDGRNVIHDNYWPTKAVWHGSDINGEPLENSCCREWSTNSSKFRGKASRLNDLLSQNQYSCDLELIVLCIELKPYLQRDFGLKKRKRYLHYRRKLQTTRKNKN